MTSLARCATEAAASFPSIMIVFLILFIERNVKPR